MVHDGKRVSLAQRDIGRFQDQGLGQPRGVNGIVGQRCKLGQIAANKFSLRVKLFALTDGVEYAEIRLCIAATGTGPLPPPVVGGQIKIDQVLSEILFSPAPIDAQVFHQETGHHHA